MGATKKARGDDVLRQKIELVKSDYERWSEGVMNKEYWNRLERGEKINLSDEK